MLLFGTLAHELETVVECLPEEEDDAEDIEMPGDELRDGSEGEEQEPMEDGEQRDGSVAEHAGLSKRDLERVKKALMKLHANLGHLGVKELIRRVLKHGRASELAIQEARRMLVMPVLKTCNQNFHVLRSLVKCWISMNGSIWTFGVFPTGKVSQNL